MMKEDCEACRATGHGILFPRLVFAVCFPPFSPFSKVFRPAIASSVVSDPGTHEPELVYFKK